MLNNSSLGFPNADGVIEVSSSPYTAPENGYVIATAKSGSTFDNTEYVYGNINGIVFAISGSRSVNNTQWLPIKQGQVLTFTKASNNSTVHFYPLLK